jgi:hypothetical protein
MLYKNKMPQTRSGILLEDCLEIVWLRKIFPDINFIKMTSSLPISCIKHYKDSGAIPLIVYSDISMLLFAKLTTFFSKHMVPFEVIHLSDEYGRDNLSWYNLEFCRKIYRNYVAPRGFEEFPQKEKVWIFPIGPLVMAQNSHETLPTISERPYAWSFAGRTIATQRHIWIQRLLQYNPFYLYLFTEFMDKNMKLSDAYIQTLKTAKFVPILAGANLETYRLYEALEFGAIPLYIRQADDDIYFRYLQILFPDILDISEPSSIFNLNIEELELYRQKLLICWNKIKSAPFVSLTDLENTVRTKSIVGHVN